MLDDIEAGRRAGCHTVLTDNGMKPNGGLDGGDGPTLAPPTMSKLLGSFW